MANTTEERRLLEALASGSKTTIALGGGERAEVVTVLHGLWKRGAVAWDWGAERWKLGEKAGVKS